MLHNHTIVDMGKHFVIDPSTRMITSTVERVVLVQGDHNSERYTFELPRIIDGHDMSLTDRVEIHYDNISKDKKYTNEGLYISKDVTVNGDKIEFSWLVSANATQLAGKTQFWINFICLDDDDNLAYSWGTETFKSIQILANNSNTEAVIQKFPDILSQWKQEVLDSIETDGESLIDLIESPSKDGTIACLRDLDSGMYILVGRFKPYRSATTEYAFTNNILASIIRDDDVSYVQIFYPKNNTIQYLEIADDFVSRKDAKLIDMQSVSNLTTTISNDADDTHYPSAKAVKSLVDTMSGVVTTEQIARAVADYLEENPIDVGSIAAIGTVELPADKWVGSDNLYSQVVSIDGVTEYSQVDLTPSVEQLVIFYEKDLTFVTENYDGVVTVYAIGQRPMNDYTIQVTITEVEV